MDTPDLDKKRPTGNHWGCWVLVLLFVCGGVGLASMVRVTPSASRAPAATARPTTTSTPAPTTRPVETSTPEPSVTDAPTATMTPTYASGGLGQDRAWWERVYGKGEAALLGQMFNRFEVVFAVDMARYIERQHIVAMPFVGAQREIRSLLPGDSEFIELTMPDDRPGTWIELYRSPSLAVRFANEVWPNAEPGEFIVIYKLEDDQKVTRVIVATGNDP